MRVVVLGGTGFLGGRAVDALKKVGELEVAVASRHSAIRVDLTDPATFGALKGAEVVVDLADATTFPPDALAAWCLDNGVTFVETTSDMLAVERLSKLSAPASSTGAVVLGAGIFTGLSNLLAHRAAAKVGKGAALDLAIRTTPFSGAGKGTVNLMAGMLSVGAISYRDGARIDHPPVGRGPRVDFPSGAAPTLRVPLAEQVMLQRSTESAALDVYFAPKPALLVWSFLSLPMFVLRSSVFAAFMRAYFSFLRRFVLANRSSTTEMVTTARSAEGTERLTLVAKDGMFAGGVAIAAIVAALAERHVPAGVHMVDEILSLDDVLPVMNRIEPGAVEITGS